MNILIFIFRALYFFLPAYLTNIAATVSRKIRLLKFIEKPVDLGKTLNGRPIFGSHKTWRGLICGIIAGILASCFQKWLYQSSSFIKNNSLIPYDKIDIFLFGFLISLGTILGDLLFAFLKRRQDIPPGAPWIPFDQINYVIGTFLLTSLYIQIEMIYWLIIFVLTILLHIIVNYLGYILGLSRAKL